MATDHVSADAASVPSSASVAYPANPIVSPTANPSGAIGVVMTTFGGVLPGVTRTVATSLAPSASLTRTATRTSPATS